MRTVDILFLLFGFTACLGVLLLFFIKKSKAWVYILGFAGILGLAWFATKTLEERAYRRYAEAAAVEQEAARDRAKAQAQIEYAENKARAEAERKQKEAERIAAEKKRLSELRAMSPIERMAELTRLCSKDSECIREEMQLVEFASATVAERDRLTKRSEALQKARKEAEERADRERERKEDIAARELFAKMYEQELFKRRLNPQRVATEGKDKSVLNVTLFLCSRQWLYDFQNGTDGKRAKSLGFTRVKCSDGFIESGWADL